MMFTETVRITVLTNGKKYVRTVDIVSDGCYNLVQNIVADIVQSEWKEQEILQFYWNYA